MCLGEEADGQTSRVKIVGSSCERTAAPQANDVQKSEDQQRGVTLDDETRTALQLQR